MMIREHPAQKLILNLTCLRDKYKTDSKRPGILSERTFVHTSLCDEMTTNSLMDEDPQVD